MSPQSRGAGPPLGPATTSTTTDNPRNDIEDDPSVPEQAALRWPLAWHEQCEWEADQAYAEGYAAGYAAAEHAIVAEFARTVGEKPATVGGTIRWLLNSIDSESRRRRAARRNAA